MVEIKQIDSPIFKRDFTTFVPVLKILVAILYCCAFQYAYSAYLPKYWGYWGFKILQKDIIYFVLSIVIATVPVIWMKSANHKPSTLFFWILYIVVYVPTIIVSFNVAPYIGERVLSLWLALLIGFGIMSFITHNAPINLKNITMPVNHFLIIISTITVVLFALIFSAYGSSIDIFAYKDIYKQRFAVAEIEVPSAAVYAYWWLSHAILPLGIVWGLHNKSWVLTFICFVGQILMFGVGASKAAGLSAFISPLMYLFCRAFRTWFGVTLLAFTALLVTLAGQFATDSTSIVGIVVSTLLARTLGIPGLATVQYYDFFEKYGLTYWSQVKGIGWFVDYPYSQDIPYVIGTQLYRNPQLSWNANLWASDGLASAGLPGIILISVVAGFVFRILDQACKHIDPRVTAAWALTPAMALANIGLFTAILTEGLGMMILLALFLPRQVKIDNEIIYLKHLSSNVA